MKRWINILYVVTFILCLGTIIGTCCVIVNCCSGNSELMYDGILDNTKTVACCEAPESIDGWLPIETDPII